jgi:glutaredoxin
MLQKRKVSFRTLYIDLMVGSERNDAMRQLKRVNPSVSFPTLVIGETVIVGNKQEEIKKALDGL